MPQRLTHALLIAFTLLAAALRLVRLGDVPPGLFLDEAGNGLDALDVWAGQVSIFFERSLGKEPLLNYLIVPLVAAVGREPLAVRLPAALVGVLTVPATFLLARELIWEEGRAKATWVGLVAAGLVAASFWATTLNRISFRANTLPLMAALAFTLAWRSLRRGGRERALAAGVVLGLCFYTYIAGRFVYPLALAGLALLAASAEGRSVLRRRRRELAIMAGAAATVMLPLLAYFALHPEDFTRRAGMVAFTAAGDGGLSATARLVESLLGNLGMFGFVGDQEPRHNLPGRSLLTPWLAALFWLGMALALATGWRRPQRLFMAAWFSLLLLPAILAADPPRHALRSIGALPIVYALIALALVELAAWLGRRLQQRPAVYPLAVLGLVALVAVEAALTAHAYFRRWAPDPAVYFAFLGQDRAVAELIKAAPSDVTYVVPLNDRWRELGGKYTLDFLVGRRPDVLYYFPQRSDAAEQLGAVALRPGARGARVARFTVGDDVSADPQGTATLLLAQAAQPTAVEPGQGFLVEVFHLAAAPGASLHLPQADQPVQARFRDREGRSLALVGWGLASSAARTGAHVTSGGLGAAALRWQVEQPPGRLLRASLRLLDSTGRPVGQADSDLVDTRPAYSADWQAGDVATTLHPVQAAPGTPPGIYRLQASVYAADTLQRLSAADEAGLPAEWIELGPVAVGEPLPLAAAYAPPAPLPEPVALTPGLTALGSDPLPASAVAGLPLALALAWEVTDPDAVGPVSLWVGDRDLGPLALPTLPRGRWRTTHRLLLPADVPVGTQRLALRGGEVGQVVVPLGALVVEPMSRPDRPLDFTFANGVVLAGWRMDRAGPGVVVTLFWTADRPVAQEWTVFVHLLDAAGAMVAQHDSPPDEGRFPTSLWPVNTPIPDRHPLAVAELPAGARLRVGLYLPSSGARLPLAAGGDFAEWTVDGPVP
ncbi:MAG: glycosyltransferase family 39 protein [Anaerolineae bacterium]|nr:glycosyltransferase family 39 protein [Anaerolineae bacterium]